MPSHVTMHWLRHLAKYTSTFQHCFNSVSCTYVRVLSNVPHALSTCFLPQKTNLKLLPIRFASVQSATRLYTYSKKSPKHIPFHRPVLRAATWNLHQPGSHDKMSLLTKRVVYSTHTSSEAVDKIFILVSCLARLSTNSIFGIGSMPLLMISHRHSAADSLSSGRER